MITFIALFLQFMFSTNILAGEFDFYTLLLYRFDLGDQFYVDGKRYLMSREPLCEIDRYKFRGIYTEWDFWEITSIPNGQKGAIRGAYACAWSLSGDSLYLQSIIRNNFMRDDDDDIYAPYTYDEVKSRMEDFTGRKFGANGMMFADWFTGEFYVMSPFAGYSEETMAIKDAEERVRRMGDEMKSWVKNNTRRYCFDKGKLLFVEPLRDCISENGNEISYYYHRDKNSENEESVLALEIIDYSTTGLFWGTTDEFDSAREGFLPGYFVLPLADVYERGDTISFSLSSCENSLFEKPLNVMNSTADKAREDGNRRYKNSNYYKNRTAKYVGMKRGNDIVLKNLDSYGDERLFARKPLIDIMETQGLVFIQHEAEPEFPGGMKKYSEYIDSMITDFRNRSGCLDEGRAFVDFMVEQDGTLLDFNLLKSSGNERLDSVAMCIASSMPKFIPAEVDGKSVKRRMVVPVKFKKSTR